MTVPGSASTACPLLVSLPTSECVSGKAGALFMVLQKATTANQRGTGGDQSRVASGTHPSPPRDIGSIRLPSCDLGGGYLSRKRGTPSTSPPGGSGGPCSSAICTPVSGYWCCGVFCVHTHIHIPHLFGTSGLSSSSFPCGTSSNLSSLFPTRAVGPSSFPFGTSSWTTKA